MRGERDKTLLLPRVSLHSSPRFYTTLQQHLPAVSSFSLYPIANVCKPMANDLCLTRKQIQCLKRILHSARAKAS